ncbi:MAG: hypothetical protein U1E17_06655 [Geminicoccaceae bacterium]
MPVLFPLDDDGRPIPVLGFDYRGTQKLVVGATSVRNATAVPGDVRIISLIATGVCRFEIGDASVTADPATSPVLFPGQYVDVPLRRGEHYVAFVAEGSGCDAYIVGRI